MNEFLILFFSNYDIYIFQILVNALAVAWCYIYAHTRMLSKSELSGYHGCMSTGRCVTEGCHLQECNTYNKNVTLKRSYDFGSVRPSLCTSVTKLHKRSLNLHCLSVRVCHINNSRSNFYFGEFY
jgi:hypothetical protein